LGFYLTFYESLNEPQVQQNKLVVYLGVIVCGVADKVLNVTSEFTCKLGISRTIFNESSVLHCIKAMVLAVKTLSTMAQHRE
jgi:hypothetical protein